MNHPVDLRSDTVTRPSAGPSIRTPMERNAFRVARLSSPSRKPEICVVPSASEPSITDRWEMDLSPATRNSPLSAPPGWTIKRS